MQFIITKTSGDRECPHPNAKLDEKLTAIQDRNYGARIYTIEIDTIQDLIDLAVSHHIIVKRRTIIVDVDMPEIEIYDDYRE